MNEEPFDDLKVNRNFKIKRDGIYVPEKELNLNACNLLCNISAFT